MKMDLAERIRSILASKQLTLNQVSSKTAALYGRESRFFLPHNLYYELRSGTSSPSIYQLFALSHISGYRLTDWLRVFGFQLEDVPRLQLALPAKRTLLLDPAFDDPNSWIPWLDNRVARNPAPPLAPLGQLVEFTHARRLSSLSQVTDRGFFYVKIGREDALGFPQLVPGSIVRANPRFGSDLLSPKNSGTTRQLFLIEHSNGLFCCRLRVGDTFIVPVSTQLSYAQIELHVPSQARILGMVDLEIRPALAHAAPEVPKQLAKHWEPISLASGARIGELLRRARAKLDLSLRDASALSRRVADSLGDDRYFISQSSLCDYEVLDAPPRHFHVCVLYGLQFRAFLVASGISPEQGGTEFMPDYLIPRSSPAPLRSSADNAEPDLGGFLGQLLSQGGEIPLFLRNSIAAISALPEPSLDVFFWTGGERKPLHPHLINALVVLVDRRKRKPLHFRSKPLWQQPIYVLQKRDGTYLCACCGIENGSLVLHPYSSHFCRQIKLRYHDDAEVIGQVVTIARKLL